jgi:hypothetical protein
MPAPFPKARPGQAVKDAPTGFPLYVGRRQPRIVTADVWAFLRYAAASRLAREDERAAVAFIEQAFEFFEAAANPRIGSRPLLYYYSFLNLAKVLLLIRRVKLSVAPKHGLSDPKENVRKRLQLSGQGVRFLKAGRDHSELFPEFAKALGTEIKSVREMKVIALLRQIPGIHRTFCKVTGEKPSFLPVQRFELLRNKNKIHVRMVLNRGDADVRGPLRAVRRRLAFRRAFAQVVAGKEAEIWFETGEIPGVRRATDTAINGLAERIRRVGVWSILTGRGNRYYLSTIPPRDILPGLASVYAVMFYLGSITRYKPYDFDRIVSRQLSWLIGEFLRTQPTQFLYGLASHVAGVDVVRPFAAVD